MDKTNFNKKSEWRKFGFGLGIILALVASYLLYKDNDWYIYLYGAGVLVALLAMAAPIVLKPLYILFSYIGFIMSWFITRVILTLLFYLVVTPITLISKLVRKKFLQLDFPGKTDSYWITQQPLNGEERINDYENQF